MASINGCAQVAAEEVGGRTSDACISRRSCQASCKTKTKRLEESSCSQLEDREVRRLNEENYKEGRKMDQLKKQLEPVGRRGSGTGEELAARKSQ